MSEGLLAPYGRAWAKVMAAYRESVAKKTDDELHDLVRASAAGRHHRSLTTDEYGASFEVERAARAELNSRNNKPRKD